ncbi:MAG: hypothetical protein NDI69_01255 [Bacteriovoracaceae bacterium]|nr:hypothetical protein [Bacteriovoracaceae bacterium]
MLNVLILLSLLAVTACSQSGSNANLKITNTFALGDIASSPMAAGGLMIWGQGPDGQTFGRILKGSSEVSVNLPNGEWTFYAMAWSQTLAGTPSCALGKASLTGDPVAVDLALDNAFCAQTEFSGGAATGGISPYILPNTKLEFCEKVDATFSTYTDACTDDLSNPNRKSGKGSGVSYRFRARAFDRIKGANNFLADEIPSACFSGEPMAAQEESGLAFTEATALPGGILGATPFHLTLDVFFGTNDCDATLTSSKGKVSYELAHGVRSSLPNLKAVTDPSMASARHKLYVEISPLTICSGLRLTSPAAQPYAAGNGSAGRQYLICTAAQLQAMVTSDPTKHYKLLNDIDLNHLSKGLTALSTPSWYSCLEEGSNFFPIGASIANCHTTTPGSFSGSFNGNNKKIKGLRIRLEQSNEVGMFATTNGIIKNIILEKPEISGATYVGALTGRTSSAATLKNIKIIKASIDARERDSLGGEYAGTLTGYAFNTVIDNVIIEGTDLVADRGSVGGLAGHSYNSTISNVLVSGIVKGAINQWQGVNYSFAGGLLGGADNSTISKSRFEGYVRGQNSIGGLVGYFYNSNLSDSYAQAGIYSMERNAAPVVGGLFGIVTGTAGTHKVQRSFFTGDISHTCLWNNVDCQISEVAGQMNGLSNSDFVDVYYPPLGLSGTLSTTSVGISAFLSSHFTSNAFPNLGTAFDQTVAGDHPRLLTETTHPCRQNGANLSAANQMSSPYFRGTITNPILVCNPNHLTEMQTSPGAHYKLAGFVVAPGFNNIGPNFTGSLDGSGFGILGLKLIGASGISLFNEVSGVIKNISFLGSSVHGNGPTALIAQTLSGTVEHLGVDGLSWFNGTSADSGGLFKFISATGKLNKARIDLQMRTTAYTGGIANTNDGKISNIRLNGGITNSDPATYYLMQVGGVVVTNNTSGKISQVENNINIWDNANSLNADGSSLALFASANLGTIEDVHIRHGRISTNTSQIAGVVSLNYSSGIVRRVINNGQIQVMNTLHGRGSNEFDVSATVGTYFGSSAAQVTENYYSTPGLWLYPFNTTITTSTDATYCYVDPANWMLQTPWQTGSQGNPLAYGVFNDKTGFLPFAGYITSTFKIPGADNCMELSIEQNMIARPGASPGTLLTAANNNWATFSGWNFSGHWVANSDDPNEMQRIFALYAAYLKGETLPEAPPVWEYTSDEGMRLFWLDD